MCHKPVFGKNYLGVVLAPAKGADLWESWSLQLPTILHERTTTELSDAGSMTFSMKPERSPGIR
jgi:hypothetical protein